jgi:hypothetical protein
VHLAGLQPGAWAQVTFEAEKILALAHKGEELKDSYHISGRSVLRLVTSEGPFDYDLSIEVTVDDVPF